jgi:lipopolysaccharide/colanic/teichoic acid biosynthesis glycosyltransferase
MTDRIPPAGSRRLRLSTPSNPNTTEILVDLSSPLALPTYVPGPYDRFFKPTFDRLAGVILSILFLPLVIVITLAIWRTMGRPAILGQQRVGRYGRVFTMYKFRTMLPDRREQQEPYAGPDRRKRHKSPYDPRLTPLGRFLRKWSLDELPQLWNVGLGQMSLVGPRPELVEIVARYEPWQHLRHLVKPGMTGIWQISARGEAMMHECTHIDLQYLDQVDFLTDLKILLWTIPAALGRRPGF